LLRVGVIELAAQSDWPEDREYARAVPPTQGMTTTSLELDADGESGVQDKELTLHSRVPEAVSSAITVLDSDATVTALTTATAEAADGEPFPA
jgi:hypothetical protein